MFLFALLIIFFADLILSEIGFSNKTGIFEFKNCTVSVSCKTFGVATTTASGLSLSNNILVFLYSGTLNFFANSLPVFLFLQLSEEKHF